MTISSISRNGFLSLPFVSGVSAPVAQDTAGPPSQLLTVDGKRGKSRHFGKTNATPQMKRRAFQQPTGEGQGENAPGSSGLSQQTPEASSSFASVEKDKAPGDGKHASTPKQEKSTPSNSGKQNPSDHLSVAQDKPATSRGRSMRRRRRSGSKSSRSRSKSRSKSRSPHGRKPAPVSAQQGEQQDVTSTANGSDVDGSEWSVQRQLCLCFIVPSAPESVT